MKEVLIINTEYFLQCHGSCSGCFLTNAERQSSQTFKDNIFDGLKHLAPLHQYPIEHLVIGFGRGNLLNLEKLHLDELLNIMAWCEDNFNYQKITFEVSSSLIGKIEQQIEKAHYLLNKNKHIYFNIVINSEITSSQFWINLDKFFEENRLMRESWGWSDNTADILVLNVNPKKLPDIHFIKNFTMKYPSPVNISIFPFEENIIISSDIKAVNDWSENMWNNLNQKDLNIKNYLEKFQTIDLPNTITDLLNYHKTTENSYIFIDKNGLITPGSMSIMGEVDYLRLLDKYQLEAKILDAYKIMQKRSACAMCSHQKECLVSGAYLNLLANHKKMTKDMNNQCASGYQKVFESALHK